jgi:nitrilase
VGLTRDITRFIAQEGRCYVLSAGSLLTGDAIPAEFPLRAAALTDAPDVLYDGGSAVAAPDGTWMVEPVSGDERLVIVEIDRARVRGERQNFDPAGHYFRSDIFNVTIDRTPREPVEFVDE